MTIPEGGLLTIPVGDLLTIPVGDLLTIPVGDLLTIRPPLDDSLAGVRALAGVARALRHGGAEAQSAGAGV